MENSKYVSFSDCFKICRTCLSYKTSDLLPIEEVQRENVRLIDIVSLYLSVNPKENDKLPQKMCNKCIMQMFNTHTFLEKCKASESYLQDVYEIYEQNPGAIYLKVEDGETQSPSRTHGRKKESELNSPKVESQKSNSGKFESEIISTVKIEEDIINDAEYIFLSDTDRDNDSQVIVAKIENDINENMDSIQNYLVTPQQIIIKPDSTNEIESSKSGDSIQPHVLKIEMSDDTESADDKQETQVHIKQRNIRKRCEECMEDLENPRALKLHWKTYNHFPKHLRCTFCSRGFANGQRLKMHVNIHTFENVYKCEVCFSSFSHRGNLKRHLLTHTNVTKYRCEQCDRGFTRIEFLRNHQRKQHGKEKLLCTYCGKAFCSYSTFFAHEKEHAQTGLDCRKCGKFFTTEHTLAQHKKVCHATKIERRGVCSLTCPHCGDTFPNKYETREHKLHSECYEYLDKFPCNECGKVFFTAVSLAKHEWLHKEEKSGKTYKCNSCDLTFPGALQLYKHNYRHNNPKKNVCSYCGKAFHSKSHLGYHLRLHTGEKPYVCDVCNKGFAIKGNLTAHMVLHMEDRPTYQCEVCKNVYLEKKGLRRHCKNVHDLIIAS